MQQCWVVGPNWRCSGHEGSTLMNGLIPVWKGLVRVGSLSAALLPCEEHPPEGMQAPSYKWILGPHQTPNLYCLDLGLLSQQNYEK